VAKIKAIIAAPGSGFTMPAFDPNQSQEDRQAAMQGMIKKVQDQSKKVQEDSLAVLSDDQSIAWADLCGKTFKFPANAGFGGMRPPQQ
jgi:hypothetical protein